MSASSAQEGSSSGASTSKTEVSYRGKGGQKRLPSFFIGSYEAALRQAKEQMKVLMVVLVTDEHDDVSLFKRCAAPFAQAGLVSLARRSTLTNEELLQALDPANFVVWGGDVGDRDAFQGRSSSSYDDLHAES